MLRRYGYLALIALILASEVGCCSRQRAPWPGGLTWCGSNYCQCYWSEWFSHPPQCHDPCDLCGNYIAPKTSYVRHGGPPMGPPYDWPYGYEKTTGDSAEAAPTPARRRAAPVEAVPTPAMEPTPAEPMPAEELPVDQPSAAVRYNEFGQSVSYDQPVESPRTSRTLRNSRPRTWTR